MLLEEQDCTALSFSNPEDSLPLFSQIAPASFAERFPRLTFVVVAAAILLATATAEIDCLRGSGYFWR
jgi:hypothetical protein